MKNKALIEAVAARLNQLLIPGAHDIGVYQERGAYYLAVGHDDHNFLFCSTVSTSTWFGFRVGVDDDSHFNTEVSNASTDVEAIAQAIAQVLLRRCRKSAPLSTMDYVWTFLVVALVVTAMVGIALSAVFGSVLLVCGITIGLVSSSGFRQWCAIYAIMVMLPTAVVVFAPWWVSVPVAVLYLCFFAGLGGNIDERRFYGFNDSRY